MSSLSAILSRTTLSVIPVMAEAKLMARIRSAVIVECSFYEAIVLEAHPLDSCPVERARVPEIFHVKFTGTGAKNRLLETLERRPKTKGKSKQFQELGRLAQLVEHLVYTERVGGSNPSLPTKFSTSMEFFLSHLLSLLFF